MGLATISRQELHIIRLTCWPESLKHPNPLQFVPLLSRYQIFPHGLTISITDYHQASSHVCILGSIQPIQSWKLSHSATIALTPFSLSLFPTSHLHLCHESASVSLGHFCTFSCENLALRNFQYWRFRLGTCLDTSHLGDCGLNRRVFSDWTNSTISS